MLKNYLKTTYRYLRNYKLFTAINLFGLASALCVTYFAILYIHLETSYDDFNANKDRVYRISTDIKTTAGTKLETSAAALASNLAVTFPGVEKATRIFIDYYIVQKDKDPATEETLAYADSSMFSVFSFSLIRGRIADVFNAPYNLVLSEKYAKRYFGSTDCLGKTLKLDGNITATVTGVMKDIPLNSHFRTDMLLSMSSLIQPGTNWIDDWSRFGFSTYVLLKPNANMQLFKQMLASLTEKHPLKNSDSYNLVAEPLSQLYLHGSIRESKAGATAHGNATNIYTFSIVAVFVLLIACFNFINLTTAFSLKRVKEIGVRKVIGASKKQLTFQFLTDAIVLALIAFVLSVLLTSLLLPFSNQMAGKTIASGIFANIKYLSLFFVIAVFIGFLSGSYPAFFLSRFQPVTSLKGKYANSTRGLFLRRVLVIAQFTISIVLIVATLIIYKQMNFMKNENLGFKKEHNIVIDFHYDNRIIDRMEMVQSELTKIPGIQYASASSAIPGRPNKKFPTTIEGINYEKKEFQCDAYFVDYNFLKQYGIEVIAGRAFSKSFATDLKESMIINEALVKQLGFANAQQAIGKQYWQRGGTGQIIGVVKDFHFHSLHEEIQPLTIQVTPGFFTFLTLSVSSDNLQQTINKLEKKWAALVPGLPMIYSFTDETFNAQYIAEARFGKLFICFASLAILISCLGLLGLSAFNITLRTKEIGIRKVLGASSSAILKLLTKEFFILVSIAFLIASPVAWILMKHWLNDFPYRVNISFLYFVMAGSFALLTAFATISFQAVKAAIVNPVESLRSE